MSDYNPDVDAASNVANNNLALNMNDTEICVAQTSNKALLEKSQSLCKIANNTFKDLCRTLEEEQVKISDLEKRRQSLQAEMLNLKAEIEAEMKSYDMNLNEDLSPEDGAEEAQGSDAEEPPNPLETESLVNIVQKIKHGLQSVVGDLSVESEQLMKAVSNHENADPI